MGYIAVIQEARIRFVTDDGHGFLLTLARHSNSTVAEMERLQRRHARVRLEYSGSPNTGSGLVHKIQTLADIGKY